MVFRVMGLVRVTKSFTGQEYKAGIDVGLTP